MTYKYMSPIGEMRIFYNENSNNYTLQINEENYGNYSLPEKAADDVATHHTGCDEWDDFIPKDGIMPTGVGKWSVVK